MSTQRNDTRSTSAGPWAGYPSLEAAIEGLRRARFRVESRFVVPGRGDVVSGELTSGEAHDGMVLLAPSRHYPNVLIELRIDAVETLTQACGRSTIGLVLGQLATDAGEPLLSEGETLDILERSPGFQDSSSRVQS